MKRFAKLHSLLASARIANVPSVVSNVWLGVAVVIFTNIRLDDSIQMQPATVPWSAFCLLTLAAIALYVAGNFLNDWTDRTWDAIHRPERALPRGQFTPRLYRNIATALAIAGLGLAAWVNWLAGVVALGILANIVIYTIWHKRQAWSVVPMGLCRGLLPMLGALGSIQVPADSATILGVSLWAGLFGSGLFCYIVGLSLSARGESKALPSHNQRSLPWVLFALTSSLMLVPCILGKNVWWLILVAPIPYIVWLSACRTILRKPISKYVSALLAGIPLVDWMVLLPFAFSGLYLSTPRFPQYPAEWACLLIPPCALILAILLQRLAPAT